MQKIVIIIFLILLTACSPKVQYVESKINIPVKPYCGKIYNIQFGMLDNITYTLDLVNAQKLISNIKKEQSCLKDWESFYNQVCENPNSLCD